MSYKNWTYSAVFANFSQKSLESFQCQVWGIIGSACSRSITACSYRFISPKDLAWQIYQIISNAELRIE